MFITTMLISFAVVVSINIFTLIIWHHRHNDQSPYDTGADHSSRAGRSPTTITAGFPTATVAPPTSSCAILLFGLPRAFKQYVLPSFLENVVKPNLKYQCDYFMHFYNDKIEGRSRSGYGGTIHPDDVWLLPQAIHDTTNNRTAESSPASEKHLPIVSIVNDTNATFWETRYDELMKFRNTKNQDGNFTYFPWKEPTYVWPTTLDNMVRQWHSIQRVWDHMMWSLTANNKETYKRVAIMRNDVVYISPIDIYKIPHTVSAAKTAVLTIKDESIRLGAFCGKGVAKSTAKDSAPSTDSVSIPTPRCDYDNRYVIIPNWAKYPINDRYISGPFNAVSIWAKQRFRLIDEYATTADATTTLSKPTRSRQSPSSSFGVDFSPPEPGRVMHSETFLNATVFTIIRQKLQYQILEDNWICFLRVRADGAIWIDDCHGSMVGFGGNSGGDGTEPISPPGFPGDVMEYVKPFLPPATTCRKRRLRDKIRVVFELFCKPTGGSSTPARQIRPRMFPKRKATS